MLDIKWIRENPQKLDEALKNRNMEPNSAKVLLLDKNNRTSITYHQELITRRNDISKKIGEKKKKSEDVENLIKESNNIKNLISSAEEELKISNKELKNIMCLLPNIPAKDVPIGKDENDNIVIRIWGEKPKFPYIYCKWCEWKAEYIQSKLCIECKWKYSILTKILLYIKKYFMKIKLRKIMGFKK